MAEIVKARSTVDRKNRTGKKDCVEPWGVLPSTEPREASLVSNCA